MKISKRLSYLKMKLQISQVAIKSSQMTFSNFVLS